MDRGNKTRETAPAVISISSPLRLADVDGGRYVILHELGKGGMGVVYVAYDQELDRKIALKMLREEVDGAGGARLLREAQAMAKLKHPNVVTVYDAGVDEGRVFLAMELVEGTSLDEWLAAKARSVREILDVFLAAGRGLAAAHAVGLVHRDFKPANVLVGNDGSVRVADFGLARTRGGGEPSEPTSHPVPRSPERLTPPVTPALTRAGTAVGTPRYMSPEQRRAEEPDPRADQFSFCVALYEAIAGEHPFDLGPDGEQLPGWTVKNAGGIPAHVMAALRRGLSERGEDRFPSMAELLAELARDPRTRRRRLLLAAAGVLALAASAAGFAELKAASARACRFDDRFLTGVWDAPRRTAVRAALVAARRPDTDAVVARLDDYGRAIVSMQAGACEAAEVRREQSSEVYGLRAQCLAARKARLDDLARLLAGADADVAQHALDAARGLPAVDECADIIALSAPTVLPADRALLARAIALRAEMGQIETLRLAGKKAELLPRAEKAVADAKALGFSPVEAEAQAVLGAILSDVGDLRRAEEALKEALFLAAATGHHSMEASAAMRLSYAISYEGRRADEGRSWLRLAGAAIQQTSAGQVHDRLEAMWHLATARFEHVLKNADATATAAYRALLLYERVAPERQDVAASLHHLGMAMRIQGKGEGAMIHFRHALAIYTSTAGRDDRGAAMVLNAIGSYESDVGHLDAAEAAYRRAIAILEASEGNDALALAGPINNLAIVDRARLRWDDALAGYRRATAIWEKRLGADSAKVAMGLTNIGNLYIRRNQLEEARQTLERAVAVYEKALGPVHVDLTETLVSLGIIAVAQERVAAARVYADRARDCAASAYAEDSPRWRPVLALLGSVAEDEGHPEKGLIYRRRAVEVLEKSLGPDSPMLAQPLLRLGYAQILTGAFRDARVTLERALALDKERMGETRFRLAQALWETGDRARAAKLLEEARAIYVADPIMGKLQLAKLQKWEAGRGMVTSGRRGPR